MQGYQSGHIGQTFSGPMPTTLHGALASSKARIDSLDDPVGLREAATQVAGLAATLGATHLVAASPYAKRIVGAAMLLHSSQLRAAMFAQANSELDGHSVLVVDVTLASGTSMASAARRARQSGAARVDGVVFHTIAGAVGREECGVDELKVID